MIDINLLPMARRHANDRRHALRRWIVWGGLWCVVLGAGQAIAVSSGAVVELTPVEREIERLVEERERLEGEIASLQESIERGSKSLSAARAVVDHPDWSALMARVVMLRTEGLAFRRWNLSPGAHGSLILRLEGKVPTLGGLTDFALRLEELKVFRKVTIVTATAATEAVEGEAERSIVFSIDTELLAPVPPKAGDAKGGPT